MSDKHDVPAGALAQLVGDQMDKLGLSIRDVADGVEISYEHARKISRGDAVPSRHLYGPLATLLKLDEDEVGRLANLDRARLKFPDVPVGAAQNPELEPMERVWHDLYPLQKEDLIHLAHRWAIRNKKNKEKQKGGA